MRPILLITAATLLLQAWPAAHAPALAQQGPVSATPEQVVPQEVSPGRENPRENEPNWPPGVERWNSREWDPQNVDPNEAERRGLTSPEVQRSLPPDPTPQGTRPPEPAATQEARADLYDALGYVRRAPPGLDGRPIPRPNPLASEPTPEMEPHPLGNPESLFPEGYIE